MKKWFSNFTSLLNLSKNKHADLEQLRKQLILSDISRNIVNRLIENAAKTVVPMDAIAEELLSYFKETPVFEFKPQPPSPQVIILVGSNGAGKTTTIPKLAHYYKTQHNINSVWAAADTFRAAAVEQLIEWGKQMDCCVVTAEKNQTDPASVVYQAYQTCLKNNNELLIIDTAGRMHSNDSLMREIKKINHVLKKQNPNISQKTMMVLDSTLGQSIIQQTQLFNEFLALDGLILSKLDTPGKGGAIININENFNIPLALLCYGEKIEDYELFNAKEFINSIIG